MVRKKCLLFTSPRHFCKATCERNVLSQQNRRHSQTLKQYLVCLTALCTQSTIAVLTLRGGIQEFAVTRSLAAAHCGKWQGSQDEKVGWFKAVWKLVSRWYFGITLNFISWEAVFFLLDKRTTVSSCCHQIYQNHVYWHIRRGLVAAVGVSGITKRGGRRVYVL